MRVTLPSEAGAEHFAVVPGLGPITSCNAEDFPLIVGDMEARQHLELVKRLAARRSAAVPPSPC